MFNPLSRGKLIVLAIVALVAVLVPTIVQSASPESAEAKTSQHRTWKTKHFIFHKYKTERHGWKVKKARTHKRTAKYRYWRHCWLSSKGGKKHLKCNRWHKHIRKSWIRSHRARGHSSAWVLPRYVVMCESGGNPRVVNRTGAGAANGYPAGLYQITGPTWRAYGGTAYAYSADRASVWAQGVIAKRVLANQGPRAWACW